MNMPTPTTYKFVVDGLARTCSGKTLNLLSPTPDQIDIEDIATALSRTAMYAGESEHFYSVAQHSFEVAKKYRQATVPTGWLAESRRCRLYRRHLEDSGVFP
jgi:hypothetical protein